MKNLRLNIQGSQFNRRDRRRSPSHQLEHLSEALVRMKSQVCPLEPAPCDSTGLGPLATDLGLECDPA
ncbi:hypothetical protein Scep_015077 [Stephania cephalantha]|uniref:Uncharacterized protein n=1 Tax=Stephania cephalantha TaxID=152367 RepID=A0AAP0J2E2_9MAGN